MSTEKWNLLLRILYSVATVVIAIYAFKSFNSSDSTSQKIIELFKLMQEEISKANEPHPKIVDFEWIGEPNTMISCSNPPRGLEFHFGTLNGDIKIYGEPLLKIFFGNEEIKDSDIHKKTLENSTMVLLEEEPFPITLENEEAFKKYLSTPNPFHKLDLIVKFEAIFSRAGEEKKKYRYSTQRIIDFDCNKPPHIPMKTVYDVYKPIS